jgi:tRNA (guanine-N7-)-methyltransferase
MQDRAHPQQPVEKEFGVPIPGRILPEDQWARTALKRLPEGLLDWPTLFGRTAPVIIDIGCGNGRSMLASAVARPDHDHLGVDILPLVIRYATRRANHRGLANTRWAVIGGRELLAEHVAPGSVAEIHCYHPQPYYRPEEVVKRLITPEFLLLAHRALVSGGRLVLQTDHPAYWKYMLRVVPAFFEFEERTTPWPHAAKGITRREIIARRQGLTIFRGEGRARTDLDLDTARQLAESQPLPTFNADRRLQELDALEREGTARQDKVARRRRRTR